MGGRHSQAQDEPGRIVMSQVITNVITINSAEERGERGGIRRLNSLQNIQPETRRSRRCSSGSRSQRDASQFLQKQLINPSFLSNGQQSTRRTEMVNHSPRNAYYMKNSYFDEMDQHSQMILRKCSIICGRECSMWDYA